MSISRRLALILGGIVMVFVVSLAGLNLWLADTNLRGTVDDLLAEQADAVEQVVALRGSNVLDVGPVPMDVVANFGERTFRVQIIDIDGGVVGDGDLPVDVEIVDEVRASGDDHYRFVEVDDQQFRVLTRRVDDVVIQLATDVTSIERGLDQLRQGTRTAGIVGVITAAVIGWIVARRFTKPIKDVTEAAAQIARDDDLPQPIEAERTDEIGDLADSFNDLLSALEMSREQQRRLVADAGHELRTPLTSLRLKLDFLRSEPDLDAGRRTELVEGAAVEVEALGTLVGELIDLASNGAADEAEQSIDLGELVEEVADRARVTTSRQIITTVEGHRVTARPAMVRRAISNLVGNAHKYSPPGQPIEIHEFGGGVEVRDHGPGIAPDDRDFAFDRFYRAHDTQHVAGSGIGLAIVKQVADTHGGKVWIDEAPDGGAIVGFSVT